MPKQNIKVGDYWEGLFNYFEVDSKNGKINSQKLKAKYLIVDLKESDTRSKIVSINLIVDGFPDEIIVGILNEKQRYLKLAETSKLPITDYSFTTNYLDRYNNLTIEYLDTVYTAYSKKLKFYSC